MGIHFKKTTMADIAIGKQFGYWTVIGKDPVQSKKGKWYCQCVCGTKRNIASIQLARGNSQSCGCRRQQYNLRGKVYGRWTVGEYFQSSRGEDSKYECTCECGEVRMVKSSDLRAGKSTNCGCSARVPEGTVALRSVLTTYRNTAKKRGIAWNLPTEDFMRLVAMNCHYCGRPPFQYRAYRDYKGALYMGIDRVNNDVCYMPSNVVPCCVTCNSAKRCQSQDDFYDWVRMVYITRQRSLRKG